MRLPPPSYLNSLQMEPTTVSTLGTVALLGPRCHRHSFSSSRLTRARTRTKLLPHRPALKTHSSLTRCTRQRPVAPLTQQSCHPWPLPSLRRANLEVSPAMVGQHHSICHLLPSSTVLESQATAGSGPLPASRTCTATRQSRRPTPIRPLRMDFRQLAYQPELLRTRPPTSVRHSRHAFPGTTRPLDVWLSATSLLEHQSRTSSEYSL